MNKKISLTVAIVVFLFLVFYPKQNIDEKSFSQPTVQPEPTSTPTPTPSPTPKPLTFAQMNELYGPCVRVPTLMYHHIQDMEIAASKNQQNLSVSPETFEQHLVYLQSSGYTTISMQELINFFDLGTALPTKPILLTFDDGYKDFFEKAIPLINKYQAKSTLFLATGLANNPEYISWGDVTNFSKNLVLVANHTWSHTNTNGSREKVAKEITTADTQLSQNGLNSPKVFSYPYGLVGSTAESVLSENGYQLGFTTMPGSILCKQKRLTLPRIRVGNTLLGNYKI